MKLDHFPQFLRSVSWHVSSSSPSSMHPGHTLCPTEAHHFSYGFHVSRGSMPLHMLCLDCLLCYYWIPAYLARPSSRLSSFYSELPWVTPRLLFLNSLLWKRLSYWLLFSIFPTECEFLKQGLWFCFLLNNIDVPWLKKIYMFYCQDFK